MFILLTPLYKTESPVGTQWHKGLSIYVNPHYITTITYVDGTRLASVCLHDGTVYTVPAHQIAALLGVEVEG